MAGEEFMECSFFLFSRFLKSLDNQYNCIAEEVRAKYFFYFSLGVTQINVSQWPLGAAIAMRDKSVA